MLQTTGEEYESHYLEVSLMILLVASAFMIFITSCLIILRKMRMNLWPETIGIIKSATVEQVGKEGGKWYSLPCFKFTYAVAGRNYSGRFLLLATVETGESLICRLIGHTIELRFKPRDPSIWYIKMNRIEDCEIIQEIGPNPMDLKLPGA